MSAGTPFYIDWTFWSFAAAGVAIVLSQLPPLRQVFGKGKLRVEVHGRIQLTHMVGYPNAGLYISLRNVGARSVRVSSVGLQFLREGAQVAAIHAAQYFVAPTDQKAVLLVPFSVEPSEEWGHVVLFQQNLTRQEDRRLGAMRWALRADISAKVEQQRRLPPEERLLAVADDHNVMPLVQLFHNTFPWQPGEYEMRLTISTSGGSDVVKQFRLTLFESDTQELTSYVDDYKYGFGPAIDHERHKGVFPTLAATSATT
jgi:hypothetical protein